MFSILMVEGNPYVAEAFTSLFMLSEWTVSPFPDGLLAEEALRTATHYDAVLLSNRLGSMSGVELIERLRILDHRKDVPVVMVTGSLDVDVVGAALMAGADEVLYKPLGVLNLVETMYKHIERRHPARSDL